jgi:hypothetical protein
MDTKFGKSFEIHVVEECGINGSILSLISDCTSHVRNDGDGFPIPSFNMKDVVSFHYSGNDAVKFLVNSPGKFTGKISNHVSVHGIIVSFQQSNVANKKCNNVSYIHYISLKKYYGGIGTGIFSAKVWPRRPAISTFVSHSVLVLISLNSVCRSEIFYRHLPITKIISFQSKSF